jgi:hypothetical protein
VELVAPDKNNEKSLKEFYQPLAAMVFVVERHATAIAQAMSELYFPENAPNFEKLSEFDRKAGELVTSHWQSRGLSNIDLLVIAKELDAQGFGLRENLQPAQWKHVARHNQQRSRSPLKTFEAVAADRRLVRQIRLRLCLARARYQSALIPHS